MNSKVISAQDTAAWRNALLRIPRVDVCQVPEYHNAYAGRTSGSRPLLWTAEDGNDFFCYPFLLCRAVLVGPNGEEVPSEYFDISSVYGYSGPLSSSANEKFLQWAWKHFDEWAQAQCIIAEFVRFSIFANSTDFAHPEMAIDRNRPAAVSYLPEDERALLQALGKKTRNMIRKAEKAGLEARRLPLEEWLPEFRRLYQETMDRNQADDFFMYDDGYYRNLLALPGDELQLFGVFRGDQLISAAIALVHGEGALYHLGATERQFLNLGASNLCLYQMGASLLRQGVRFLNLGGGRTVSEDDPLLEFKKRNATGLSDFFIGKRILNRQAYGSLAKKWSELHKIDVDFSKVIFYR